MRPAFGSAHLRRSSGNRLPHYDESQFGQILLHALGRARQSPPAPDRIIPHLVAGRERMLQLHKGLRVSAPEPIEPGRELMLTVAGGFNYIGGKAGASVGGDSVADRVGPL